MKILSTLIALSFLVSCTQKKAAENKTKTNNKIIAGEYLIKFTDSSTREQQAQVLQKMGKLKVVDREDAVVIVKRAEQKDSTEFVRALEQNKIVEFAEPHFRVKTGQIPQDPYWLKLWGLKNYGQDSPMGIEGHKGADIGVLKAWQTHKGSKDIVVAVIDTGVDYSHPDLVSNMWVNLKEKNGVPGVDDDGNGYVDDIHGWDSVSDHRDRPYFGQVGDPDPMDDYGHGTHVAGTIGAVGGNGIGVVGVNWSVSIMAVKFLDEFGSGSTIDEYRAFKYILANKVDVVNGSYGGGGRSRLIEGMIQKGREQGILFVFAAGNETENLDVTPGYPASYPYDNVVSVAATDARDQLADFSNYGQTSVHVAAPGVDIYSTIPTKMKDEMGQWKTVDQPYASYSGTSMASPHVAGAAALLIAADTSLRHQPHLTKQRLMDTSELVPTLANAVVARGRISVDRAIANQTQSSLDLAGVWEEVEVNIQTPKFPQELVDNSWQLHYPGAKAIQVHVKFAQVESGFDVAYLYDYRFRPVLNLTGEVYDKWSPVIVGDSAYLKFSNSLVKIGDREAFANFNSEGVQIDKVKILK